MVKFISQPAKAYKYICHVLNTHKQLKMCTLEKRGNVYILTLTGTGEHRLNPTLIDSIRSALSQTRSDPNPTALVTTSEPSGKFFSNGYDLAWANSGPDKLARIRLMSSKLRELVKDLHALPMPTVAAVTGHASAAGMAFAASHDYVVMRRERGFLYMSELDIGLPVPAWFVALVRSKVKSPSALRDVALAAKKLSADVAVEIGIVDAAYEGAEATVEAAVKLGEKLVKKSWDGHVYAQIRKVLRANVLKAVEFDETVEDPSNATKYGSRL